jgi:hypothetical protein
VHVDVFELGGGRRHEIRVIRGVGLELFEDDREQILAPKPGRDFAEFGATATGLLL